MITYGSTTLTSYNSIVNTEVYYYKSTSPTALSGGLWSTTKPTWESGKYVWQKIRTIYEDETYTESDPVNITGQQGQTGDAAYSYKLNASDTAVTVSKTGEYSVNKITFTATYKQGTGAVTAYAGRFKIETTTNGTNWTAVYTSSGNESSKEYTIPTNIIAIRCSLYQAGGASVLLDIITIPIVNDDRPLVTKTYTELIGSANDAANASFYFAKIHPTSYTTNYKVKMKVRVTAPEAYAETIDIQFGGYGSAFSSYDSYTTRTGSVGVYYINLYKATQAGISTNHKGHALGIGLRSSTNPTNTSYKRTVIIDILELDGCTIEMLDTAVKYANIDGTGSTNYYGLIEMAVATAGQNATNNTNTSYTQYANAVKAGTFGVKRYTLLMKDSENTWSSFINQANSTATTKTVCQGGFLLGKLLYSAGGAEYASGANTSIVFDAYPFDFRYSTNCGQTLISHQPVYLVGTIENDGLFYLDVSQWWTQTEPTYADGKVYIYVGMAYSTYQVWLNTENPAYVYYNGEFILYDKAVTLQNIASLKDSLETQIDSKVETWCQKANPASNWTAEERPNHTGDLWYFIGESDNTYKNNTTYQYNGSTNTWSAYSANPDLFDKIDGKTAIYYGTQSSVTSAEEGDYLVDETDGSSYRWNNGAWVKVTDYKTAIDNIQIGGRNLLRNTSITRTGVATKYGLLDILRPTYSSLYALDLDEGEYTLSFDWESSIELPASFYAWIGYGDINGQGRAEMPQNIPAVYTGKDSTSGHYVRTFTWANANDTYPYFACRPFRTSVENALNDIEFTIKNAKLEKGNKATDWTPAPEDIEASIQKYAQSIQSQVDGMAEIHYGTVVPTLSNAPYTSWEDTETKDMHVDDLYYNTSTGYCYRFIKSGSTYSWTRIKDSDITAAATAASNANTAAGNAQTTANNANTLAGQKRRIFVAQPTPPYEVGDLWVEGSNGDIKKCKTARATGSYTVSDWELASKYTDDTKANTANTKVDNLKKMRLGWKVNHDVFTTTNNGECYFHGYDSNNAPADVDGKVEWNGTDLTITKGMWINPNGVAPYNTPILHVFRTNTSPYHADVWWNESLKKWQGYMYTTGHTPGTISNWTWNETTDCILATYISPSNEGAIQSAQLFNPPKKFSEISDPSELYIINNAIISRGEQLVVNGNGMMGNNYNFSSLIFDGSKSNGSPGSFTRTAETSSYTITSNEFFPITPSKTYLFSFDAMTLNNLSTMYAFIDFYDVDKLQIRDANHMYRPNTLTTLKQELKNGDTVVYLNNISNWETSGNYKDGFIFWNYINSFGYQYPEQTYSRYKWGGLFDLNNINKTNNTITLKAPWNYGTFPAGTKLSQCHAGGNYKYLGISGAKVPNVWTSYKGRIGNIDYSGNNLMNMFPPGTAYAKVGFLWNYNKANDQTWVTNISVKEDVTRGTGFYSITTAPTSYTIAIGGFTPAYRIALSTVKTESGLEEVMVGDVIQQGYNTYPVGYVDASYVYLGAVNSIRGATGAAGLNTARVILYRRFASAPTGTNVAPTGDVTYTFTTGVAENNLNSWTQAIPSGTDPVYMITASASSTNTTDTIPKTEWSAPVKILENGKNGNPGGNGSDGYNQATIYLYQRKSGTAPSKPSSAVEYTFSTGALKTTPTGWSRTIPANDGNPCYVTTAVAFAKTATYSIPASGWSDVVILSQDGADGVSVTNVTSTNNTADGGTSVVTITLSDGTTKTFNVKNGTKGNTGATAQWYYGTSLTHTSGTATLVATSTSGAVIGSMYLNTQTSLVYKCTAVGTNNTWTYAGDLTTGVIDNIEIGGRNLLLNTSNFSLHKYFDSTGGGTWIFSDDEASYTATTKSWARLDLSYNPNMPSADISSQPNMDLLGNTSITLSIEAKCEGECNGLFYFQPVIYGNNADRKYFTRSNPVPGCVNAVTLTENWQRYSVTLPADYTNTTYWTSDSAQLSYPNTGFGALIYWNSTGTVHVRKPKLERGNKATDWIPAPEDTQADIDTALAQSIWYATCSDAGATKSATITPVTTNFVLNVGTTVNVKFNNTNTGAIGSLTLNINNTGAKNIKYIYNKTLNNLPSADYIVGGMTYLFVYDGTYWVIQNMNYNTNETNHILNNFSGKTGELGIWQTGLFMKDGNGTYQNICTDSSGNITRTNANIKKANPNGFEVGSSVYLSTGSTTYAANANITGAVYASYGAFDSRYSLNTTLTANCLTPYQPVYLVGTINNGLYYLDTIWWTQTPDDSTKVYVLIGGCYDSTTTDCRITLYEQNNWYKYVDGVNGADGQLVDYTNRLAELAATTATSFIAVETNNHGIYVHPENDMSTGWKIGDAIELFKGGLSYIKLWIENNIPKIRIGKSDQGHVLLDNNSVDIKNNNDVIASFGETTIIGKEAANNLRTKIAGGSFQIIDDDNSAIVNIGKVRATASQAQKIHFSFGTRYNTAYGNYSFVQGTSNAAVFDNQVALGRYGKYGALLTFMPTISSANPTFTQDISTYLSRGFTKEDIEITVPNYSGNYTWDLNNGIITVTFLKEEQTQWMMVATIKIYIGENVALMIGNGSEDNRSNAVEMLWDGNIKMALDTDADEGTTDKNLYTAITSLDWENDVVTT